MALFPAVGTAGRQQPCAIHVLAGASGLVPGRRRLKKHRDALPTALASQHLPPPRHVCNRLWPPGWRKWVFPPLRRPPTFSKDRGSRGGLDKPLRGQRRRPIRCACRALWWWGAERQAAKKAGLELLGAQNRGSGWGDASLPASLPGALGFRNAPRTAKANSACNRGKASLLLRGRGDPFVSGGF